MEEYNIDESLPPTIDIPYICSLTPALRLVKNMNADFGLTLRDIIEGTVKQIDENVEVKNSLKSDPKIEGKKLIRQIDIRTCSEGPIIFKVFAFWNLTHNRWHMLMELPTETFWEEGKHLNR